MLPFELLIAIYIWQCAKIQWFFDMANNFQKGLHFVFTLLEQCGFDGGDFEGINSGTVLLIFFNRISEGNF